MAVVKSQAYGLGFSNIRNLGGFDWLGVASYPEARALRCSGFAEPIVVFDPLNHDIPDSLDGRYVIPVIYSLDQQGRAYSSAAAALICYDVDLGRFGINRLGDLRTLLKQLGQQVIGVFAVSKWSLTDWDRVPEQTKQSLQTVREVVKEHDPDCMFSYITTTWASSSTGRSDRVESDISRIGIGMYGYSYDSWIGDALRPVVTLHGKIQKKMDVGQLGNGGYAGLSDIAFAKDAAWLDMGFIHGLPRRQPIMVRCETTNTLHPYYANGMESGIVINPPDVDSKEAVFTVDVPASCSDGVELTELATNIHKAYNLFTRS